MPFYRESHEKKKKQEFCFWIIMKFKISSLVSHSIIFTCNSGNKKQNNKNRRCYGKVEGMNISVYDSVNGFDFCSGIKTNHWKQTHTSFALLYSLIISISTMPKLYQNSPYLQLMIKYYTLPIVWLNNSKVPGGPIFFIRNDIPYNFAHNKICRRVNNLEVIW